MEELVRQPLGEIRVIIGGMSTGSLHKAKKTYLWVVQNLQLIGGPPRTTKKKSLPLLSQTKMRGNYIILMMMQHYFDDCKLYN